MQQEGDGRKDRDPKGQRTRERGLPTWGVVSGQRVAQMMWESILTPWQSLGRLPGDGLVGPSGGWSGARLWDKTGCLSDGCQSISCQPSAMWPCCQNAIDYKKRTWSSYQSFLRKTLGMKLFASSLLPPKSKPHSSGWFSGPASLLPSQSSCPVEPPCPQYCGPHAPATVHCWQNPLCALPPPSLCTCVPSA